MIGHGRHNDNINRTGGETMTERESEKSGFPPGMFTLWC